MAHAHTFHHLLLGRSSRRILSRIRPEIFPEPFNLTEDDAEEDVDLRAARVEDVERWISRGAHRR